MVERRPGFLVFLQGDSRANLFYGMWDPEYKLNPHNSFNACKLSANVTKLHITLTFKDNYFVLYFAEGDQSFTAMTKCGYQFMKENIYKEFFVSLSAHAGAQSNFRVNVHNFDFQTDIENVAIQEFNIKTDLSLSRLFKNINILKHNSAVYRLRDDPLLSNDLNITHIHGKQM